MGKEQRKKQGTTDETYRKNNFVLQSLRFTNSQVHVRAPLLTTDLAF